MMLSDLDYRLTCVIHNQAGRRRWLDRLAIFVARDLPFVLVAIPLGFFWRDVKGAAVYGVAVVLSQLVVIAIQAGIKRKRPFQREHLRPLFRLRVATTSIPSGHASLCATILIFSAMGGSLFFWGAFVLSIGILFARVYAGLHYWSDILAGLLVGGFVAYGTALLAILFFLRFV
ncbi:phosphatase PAP2 family protein [Candidatus Uhrbacteria bacterium]|nr:phosphatase PAP2 family protein [Candidatus Uhrbacteria bacterium]